MHYVKKKNKKGKKVNKRLAVITAMFHDLYEKPWQNSEIKKKVFRNAHGFTHPIEASINAIIWYPEYFKNRKEAEIIIDGILHHMFPFPLRSIKNFEELELNNYNKIKKIDDDLLEMIIKSSNKNKLFNVSFKKSIYLEGKLVSKADKIVSMLKDITSFNALLACLTGKNPDLKK